MENNYKNEIDRVFLVCIALMESGLTADSSSSPRHKDSFWGQICLKVYGFYDFLKSLQIQMWWKRNYQNLKERVETALKNKEPQETISNKNIKEEIIENHLEIEFDANEKKNLVKLISSTGFAGRRFLLTEFTKLLSQKLNLMGINCTLNCLSNWFKKDQSRKKNVPAWKGNYQCINCMCKIKFCASIDTFDNEKLILHLKWSGFCQHEKVHNYTQKRCTGEERKLMAMKLMSNGISNTLNEIIICPGTKLKFFFH
jgi:hypothetical protein